MKRERIIEDLPNGDANHVLRVSVYYKKGGMNYFTGNVEKRGLYLSVSPLEIEDYENGYKTTIYTAFSGVATCVKELKRYSEKQLNKYVPDKDLIDKMITQILGD
jgi:hypothetical protein